MNLTLSFVYNRKGKLRKDGTALVQLRVYVSGEYPKFFSTGYYLKKSQWDKKREAVKSHTDSVNMNLYLNSLKQKAGMYFRNIASNGDDASAHDIITYLRGDSDNTLSGFIQKEIVDRQDIEESTKATHLKVLHYLNVYRPGIMIRQVNRPFIVRFEKWLLSLEKKRGEGKLSQNYVGLLITLLKSYIQIAVEYGLITDNPASGISIRKYKAQRIFLTKDELRLIEKFETTESREKIKIRFLFMCYTGLRYSDTCRLAAKHIIKANRGLRLRLMLQKTRKHKTEIDIPLYSVFAGKPEEMIIPLLEGKQGEDLIFGEYSLGSFGNTIKEMAKATGINKNISSKTGRHTCAMALLNDGVDLHAVSKILGHTDLKTTQVYADLLTKTVDKIIDDVYI